MPSSSQSLSDRKAQLRLAMKAKRREVSAPFRRFASAAICRALSKQPFLLCSSRIALYAAVRNEVNLAPLAQEIKSRGKESYYPALSPFAADKRMFFLSGHTDIWRLNRFGIPEPRAPLVHRVPLRTLQLILLPLLAFDELGGRLGMGGGYYDATLSGPRRGRALLVGVGYEFQRVRRVPCNRMDLRLDYAVTEKRWLRCRPDGPPSRF